MKVICVGVLVIAYLPKWASEMRIPIPEIGSEYEVTNAYLKDDYLYYELVGFIDQEFDARAFATLARLSADEINELEKEGIIR